MGLNDDLRDAVAGATFWWRVAWQAKDTARITTEDRPDGWVEKRRIVGAEQARLETSAARVGRDPAAWAVVHQRTAKPQYQRLRERILNSYMTALEGDGTFTIRDLEKRPKVIRRTVERMFGRMPELFADEGMDGLSHDWTPIVARGPPSPGEIAAFVKARHEGLTDGQPASAFISPRSSTFSDWLVLPEFLMSLQRCRNLVRARGAGTQTRNALIDLVSRDFGFLLDLHVVLEGPIIIACLRRGAQKTVDSVRRAKRTLTSADLTTVVSMLREFGAYNPNYLELGWRAVPTTSRATHAAFPAMEPHERLDRVGLAPERALGVFMDEQGFVRALGSDSKDFWSAELARGREAPDDAVALVLASFVERLPVVPQVYPRHLYADPDDVERVIRSLKLTPRIREWFLGTSSKNRSVPWLNDGAP